MFKPIFALLLLLGLSFTSCVEIPDILDDPTQTGSITAKINGEDFSVSGLLVTANLTESTANIQTLAIGGAKLPLDGITRAIALAIVSTDGNGFQAGQTYTATSTTEAAAGEYSIDDGNAIDIKAVSENTDVATITLTDIDFTQKIVSGTFSFDGADKDDLNTIYEVRDGVFKDVSFE